MVDVVTIGETMVLFEPLEEKHMKYSSLYSRTIAGAESNVAIGLARLGRNTRWIGSVGKDVFGDIVISTLAGEFIDISRVIRSEDGQTGVFFKDVYRVGDPDIYYYRKHSPSSKWTPGHVKDDWFKGARHIHMTGVTAALGDETLQFTVECMKRAKKLGLTVSFDPNIRFKLWDEQTAKNSILQLIPLCDIFMPGIDEAEFLFGKGSPGYLAEMSLESGAKVVAMKLGAEGSFGMLKNGQSTFAESVKVNHVVDTVGAGDAFAAGFLSIAIDGIDYENLNKALVRGNTISSYVIQNKGDWESLPTINEITKGDSLIKR